MRTAESYDHMMRILMHMDVRWSMFARRQVNLEDEAAFAVRLWHNITYLLGFDKYEAGCDLVSSGFYHRGWPYAIPNALGGCYPSSNPDYCTDVLSLAGKLAALLVQRYKDDVVLGEVNDIEALTSALSGRIWQKSRLLEPALQESWLAGAAMLLTTPHAPLDGPNLSRRAYSKT